MAHTDAVRANRELWFRTVPGARAAYRDSPSVRLTVDSVDSALSMADRALREQGVPEDVRQVVLHYAVFKSETDLAEQQPATES